MQNSTINHPILNDDFINSVNGDTGQIYSVEASLDSLIPWINYVGSIKDKVVLIFGTGAGGTAVACALHVGNGKIYGVDISLSAISIATKRAEIYGVSNKMKLVHMESTYPLPFKDEFFDVVIIADVIEHIIDERSKYIKNAFQKLKKEGLFIITGTPNILYPKDRHTTGLYFIPWMSSRSAYKYAIWRGTWKKGENLDLAGRRGTTYWNIIHWLNEYKYEVLNLQNRFTSKYLKSHNRLNSKKRKFLFIPYLIFETLLSKVFRIPITALMPYINHLFIIKK